MSSATNSISIKSYFAYNIVLPIKTAKLKGVRVNAYRDYYLYNRLLYKPVNILRRYPLFSKANNPFSIT